ncbi:MAG: bifunctional hydroxymethylpyrimidine kinase/phosphomethylpyrimidine kinase [Prevotella sp.]
MRNLTPILSINGSDGSGRAGVQADIRTITSLGAYALSVVTSVTVREESGIQRVHTLPEHLVSGQVSSVVACHRPAAVKIGMVRDSAAIHSLRDMLVGQKNIVLVPGLLTSRGEMLADEDSMKAIVRWLIPEARLLVMRCSEAELLLGVDIKTDDDMLAAALRLREMGARGVMLREGHIVDGILSALLLDSEGPCFFSSRNTVGWQQHGVGAALSAAIATCLGQGDDLRTAISRAHDFIHTQVVYAVSGQERQKRPGDIFNDFMNLVAQHYRKHHAVAWYAHELSISTRYLSQSTSQMVGKSPKRIIDEYIANEAKVMIATSRLTMQEIAYALGYTSQSTFCRSFRSMTGMSPSKQRG